MTITINSDVNDKHREGAGQTNGNEVIFQLNPNSAYTFECETSSGTGTLKTYLSLTAPTSFTGFTPSADGEQTANYSGVINSGVSWVGFDITLGTWAIRIRENT